MGAYTSIQLQWRTSSESGDKVGVFSMISSLKIILSPSLPSLTGLLAGDVQLIAWIEENQVFKSPIKKEVGQSKKGSGVFYIIRAYWQGGPLFH